MDPLNYSKKHRRNKPQVTSQPEASSSCLQNYSSLTAPLWLHSFLPRPADPSPAQGCPTLLSRGPGSLPSPGVMLHLGQPCPKGTLLVFGHFVPQELPLPCCRAWLSPGAGSCWAPLTPWHFSLGWGPSKWQQNHLMYQQPPWIWILNLDAKVKLDEQTKGKFC